MEKEEDAILFIVLSDLTINVCVMCMTMRLRATSTTVFIPLIDMLN